MIRVLFVAPNCAPAELRIIGNVDTLQALVGGTLSVARITSNLGIFHNDDGLALGLPPNIRTDTGALLVGNLVVSRSDANGDQIDLTPTDITNIKLFLDRHTTRPAGFEYSEPTVTITGFDEEPPDMPPIELLRVHTPTAILS